jgi:ABC-type cobalt transport system substrate-binding protein
MKNQKMKTVFVIICIIVIIAAIKSIITPADKGGETEPTSEAVSEVQAEEPETTAQAEPTETEEESQEPEVEHRTGDNIVGISDKDIEDLGPVFYKSVINDVTGNWRYATIAENVDIEYYALSYYKNYFGADNEVHAIINFTRNTTTRLNYSGGVLTVTILDYVDGEEHDAKQLFSGEVLATYYVYTDNGDIEKVE